MKKVLLLYSEYKPVIDAIKYEINSIAEVFLSQKSQQSYNVDLIINLSNFNTESENSIKTSYSLNPPFNSKYPLKEAYLNNIMVTGITVYNEYSEKIIAQYPFFINYDNHYDEILQEMVYLEQTILPIVVKKILLNEIIDSKNIFNYSKACHGNYGGCSGCVH